jgi:ribonuclease HII
MAGRRNLPVLDGAAEQASLARLGLAPGLPVAGVDEVGRGPLAGPVVAAAVILDPSDIPAGLADSKALPAARREALFGIILARALAASLGSASAREIDALDIRRATHLAMRRAVLALALRPALILVDGNDTCGLEASSGAPTLPLVKGDSQVACIAAAAIVAKVIRDRMMNRLDHAYPVYGFASHRGYGARAHLSALAEHGPCPHHRFSFAPVRLRWTRERLHA